MHHSPNMHCMILITSTNKKGKTTFLYTTFFETSSKSITIFVKSFAIMHFFICKNGRNYSKAQKRPE